MKFDTSLAGVWRLRYQNVGWVSPKGVTQRGASTLLGYAALTQPTGLISGKLSVQDLDIHFPPGMQEAG